jgi:hypothetical protein
MDIRFPTASGDGRRGLKLAAEDRGKEKLRATVKVMSGVGPWFEVQLNVERWPDEITSPLIACWPFGGTIGYVFMMRSY